MNGEVIFLRLTDVGRSIDLKKVNNILPVIKDKNIIKTKDTPSYVDFPKPLILEVTQPLSSESKFINKIILYVKLYADGVISLIARLSFRDIPLFELHKLKNTKFHTSEGEFRIKDFLKYHYNKIFEQIRSCIQDENYTLGISEHEKYTIYCLTDDIEYPKEFIQKEKQYFSTLLMGENPELKLSQNQINHSINHTFSFLDNDLIIFDFDRALIIDPNVNYEDILIVIESANYQLLELRTLDKLLEKRLSIAEEDIRNFYFKKRIFLSRYKKKVGKLIRLRYDLTFLLENIENVSKLIGDYYLAQIYQHLSELFKLKQWSDSIRHRLEPLENIYSATQTNINEKLLLYVEILLSFIFTMEFILLILNFFL
ncbi:MAG: hypothetical protein ACFE9I_07435 [Candidatus Hermodarchaeota archaeon]